MIKEIFSELETEQTYDGYFYNVGEIIVIVILGSICGLRKFINGQQVSGSVNF